MKLYIANCSKTFSVLNYRVPEIKNAMAQNVDSGQQILVAKPDLNMIQIDGILDQLRTYGLFLVEELNQMPEDKVIYWLASLDKPLTFVHIEQAFVHNDKALTLRGLEFQKAAAVAINQNIANRTPHAAGTLEVTIQEESPTNSSQFGQPLFAKGFRMDPNPDPFQAKH